MLCLEERETPSRGATILAEVTGYANFSDAVDFTSPAEDCIAREQTIRWALRRRSQPADLDYINAHGTSRRSTISTKRSWKGAGRRGVPYPHFQHQSLPGHLIAAAGSFIVCLQAMAAGILPATAHLTQPDPRCDLDYIAEAPSGGGDTSGAESELWFRRRERRAGAGETRVTLLHYTCRRAAVGGVFR